MAALIIAYCSILALIIAPGFWQCIQLVRERREEDRFWAVRFAPGEPMDDAYWQDFERAYSRAALKQARD